ncbi:hypothetical protein F5Y14DRAFT_405937 [Nemania sp. NC0429]|nr:hypothetical protein F5Y14DRAFT_405937 [Nemania sp. NC0429]
MIKLILKSNAPLFTENCFPVLLSSFDYFLKTLTAVLHYSSLSLPSLISISPCHVKMTRSKFVSHLRPPVCASCARDVAPEHQVAPERPAPPAQPPLPDAPDPRRVIVRSTSHAISGSYPLYDLLSIYTESGSINVDVTPHPASSEHPSRPASLELKSSSGSVRATFPKSFMGQFGFPARDYTTSVSSRSGSISGTFPLGSHTSLDSRSGSIAGIELIVVPTTASRPRQLSTVSHVGMQSLRIVDDQLRTVAGKSSWWDGMVSRHESHTGAVNVEYPESWEGTIEMETDLGSINVTGRGVEIIREVRGSLLARKGQGEGGGKIIIKAKTGSVNLRFG